MMRIGCEALLATPAIMFILTSVISSAIILFKKKK